MISILIATRGRSEQIISCIQSLIINTYRNFELIIIDQNTDDTTKAHIQSLHDKRITYLRCQIGGKSAALNMGIRVAHGTILAFTDDDCIVTPTWLHTIAKAFNTTTCDAITGKTLPFQPENHVSHTCPCTFVSNYKKRISEPTPHYAEIGFGNNFAVRTPVMKRLGEFKQWLGPGTVGQAAEDAELFQRLLILKNTIVYCPDSIVYHNKWLTDNQLHAQMLIYARGELACYQYFSIQGYKFAYDVVHTSLSNSGRRITRQVKNFLMLRWSKSLITESYYTLRELENKILGYFIGLCYGLIDPIRLHT